MFVVVQSINTKEWWKMSKYAQNMSARMLFWSFMLVGASQNVDQMFKIQDPPSEGYDLVMCTRTGLS